MVPRIIHDLGGNDSFAWVSAGYTISCTAILPFSGQLADTFGRRPSILAALLFFAGGSAMCGAATSLDVFIAGRGKNKLLTSRELPTFRIIRQWCKAWAPGEYSL